MQKEAIVVEGKSAVLRKADFTADTVYVLDENEVFLLSDNREGNQDWVEVEIEIDPGKFSKNANGNRESFVVGFIHKSKIQLVDSLPKYERHDVELVFKVLKDDTTNKTKRQHVMYGMETPPINPYIVSELVLKWKNGFKKQDAKFYDDLYNITFTEGDFSSKRSKNFKIFRNGDFFFIKQGCGDGAGFYEITWVVSDGLIVQRLIDEI